MNICTPCSGDFALLNICALDGEFGRCY